MNKHCKMLSRLILVFTMAFVVLQLVAIPVYAIDLPTASPAPTTSPTDDNTNPSVNTEEVNTDTGIVLGTGDAVNDILNNSRFSGAIESIQFITKFIDHWFTVIITIVAFFIISAAMLKNVCAGAYCSNQKFWNKVAEAHEKADAISLATATQYFTGKQFMNTTGGGLRDSLLCIVPNIKAWTDFDDVEVEPKQYFMKAIPQMLACIIIGIFIYNGYYRDTAATVGSVGSEICERVFSSVDPVKFVDKLSLTSKTPDNIYKSDATVEGQMRYAISSQLYKTVVSTDSSYDNADAKTRLMRNCEYFAMNFTKNLSDLILPPADADYEYSLSNLKISLIPGANKPNLDQTAGTANYHYEVDSSGTIFIQYGTTAADANAASFNIGANNNYIYLTASFKKVTRQNTAEQIQSKLDAVQGSGGYSDAIVVDVIIDNLPSTNATFLPSDYSDKVSSKVAEKLDVTSLTQLRYNGGSTRIRPSNGQATGDYTASYIDADGNRKHVKVTVNFICKSS